MALLLSEILAGMASGKVPATAPTVAAPGPSLSARLGRGDVALKTEDYRFLNPTEGPGASKDLDRICALPRRDLPLIDLTPELRSNTPCPGCNLCRKGTPVLRLIQSQALQEMRDVGGAICPIPVGFGKAGISLLASTVMGSQSTVLLIPANLREQLEKRDLPMWSRHFRVKLGVIRVVTYSQLSTAKSADILERLKPDLIVGDEIHNLRHRSAARTKRFLRYFREHPQTRLVGMSGTLTSKSILDYLHLLEIALKDGTPGPIHYPEQVAWASAIDVSDMPSAMGELRRLCNPGETARQGFQRRLVETSGVVATSKSAMDDEAVCSLIIGEREIKVPPAVEEHLSKLRKDYCRPDGEELEDALAFARTAKQMSNGFYYRWIWPRCLECRPLEPCGFCTFKGVSGFKVDREWLQARAPWHREMRSFLSHAAKPGMDSPLLLAQAASSGRWEAVSWPDWAQVKHRDPPPVETVWIDPFLVNDAVEWGRKEPGIIWYEHTAVGEALAKASDFPFFGPGEESGRRILAASQAKEPVTIIASIKAHGTGKNLQLWNKALVTSTPSGGKDWEQLLGRLHRPGQEADEVEFLTYRHTIELREAFEKAKLDALYVEESVGSRQKLNYASIIFKEKRA